VAQARKGLRPDDAIDSLPTSDHDAPAASLEVQIDDFDVDDEDDLALTVPGIRRSAAPIGDKEPS
jgi:hypothetical protein